MQIVQFNSITPAELIPLTVNFSDMLQFGESINGASATVVVFSGTDPSPTNILKASATYTSTEITQLVGGGIPGVIYSIAFLVTGTGGHNYVKVGTLAVTSQDPY